METLQNYILLLMPREDRLIHFFVGFLLFSIASIFLPKKYVILTILLIAISKEISDSYFKNSYFDLIDILFTCLPIIIIEFVTFLKYK